MTIRRDYILTMIEKLGELVRLVMRRGGSPEQIQERIDDLANELTGLPSTTLCTLPMEEVYRLISGSDRMVAEKSYAVAELSRVQGLIASDPAERHSLFRRALFFYQHCGTELGDELGAILTDRQEEMKAALDGRTEMEPDVRQHIVPKDEPPPQRPKTKPFLSWWSRLALAAVVLSLVAIAFEPAPDFEITGTTWQSNGTEVLIHSMLHNRSESSKQVTVEFLADFSRTSDYGSSLSFAGRMQQSFHLAPNSELPIEVRLPLTGTGGGQVLLTAKIIHLE